jgi:predicted nuclease of predicted toxin-antitoxin system
MLPPWGWIGPLIPKSWRAVQEDRVIVTADLDYPRLLAVADAARPSVVLFRGGNWAIWD